MIMNNNISKVPNKVILGNYTKGAVEKFEKNIVNQKDYLEKVNNNK